jgi:pyruvate ferredoxin oxidoreductase gamma subunit
MWCLSPRRYHYYGGWDRRMFTTRVLGRDDQEIMATAELLAAAAAAQGRPATVIPASGTGIALCVIGGDATVPEEGPAMADALIAADLGSPAADALIVADPGELRRADAFARLSPEAYVLVNSACGFGDLGLAGRVERFCRDRTLILPAERLQPCPHDAVSRGAGLAGGFAALCRVVGLDAVVRAIEDSVPGDRARACAKTAAAAYEFVLAEKQALAA